MDYKVVVTRDAEEDLESFIKYLVFEKESMQAAENVLNDYDATIESLKHVAGSLKLCERIYRCNCGNVMDRDKNAAINIREEARRMLTA